MRARGQAKDDSQSVDIDDRKRLCKFLMKP